MGYSLPTTGPEGVTNEKEVYMTTEGTWKKIGAILTLIVMVIGGGKYISRRANAEGTDLYAVLAKHANTVNATLAMMLDKATRLDSTVPGPGNTFTHFLTLSAYNSAELESMSAMAVLTPAVKRSTCGLTEREWFFKRGVSLVYAYRGNDGREIGRVIVTPADCG